MKHGGGPRYSVAGCGKRTKKGDKCAVHAKGANPEIEITAHVAPAPVDLLANISVKLEPMDEIEITPHDISVDLLANISVKLGPMDAATDVEMVHHSAPVGMNLLDNLAAEPAK